MGMRDERSLALNDPKEVASAIDAEFCALHVQNTPSERAVLRFQQVFPDAERG